MPHKTKRLKHWTSGEDFTFESPMIRSQSRRQTIVNSKRMDPPVTKPKNIDRRKSALILRRLDSDLVPSQTLSKSPISQRTRRRTMANSKNMEASRSKSATNVKTRSKPGNDSLLKKDVKRLQTNQPASPYKARRQTRSRATVKSPVSQDDQLRSTTAWVAKSNRNIRSKIENGLSNGSAATNHVLPYTPKWENPSDLIKHRIKSKYPSELRGFRKAPNGHDVSSSSEESSDLRFASTEAVNGSAALINGATPDGTVNGLVPSTPKSSRKITSFKNGRNNLSSTPKTEWPNRSKLDFEESLVEEVNGSFVADLVDDTDCSPDNTINDALPNGEPSKEDNKESKKGYCVVM